MWRSWRASAKTVTRALNDEAHVSQAVRRTMKEAAATLDYHPNIAAQSLIAKRSYLIGLTYERPTTSYVVDLQNGALGRLENERYRLVVLPFGHVANRAAELGKFLLRAGLDGVLLAPPACDQPGGARSARPLEIAGLARTAISTVGSSSRGTRRRRRRPSPRMSWHRVIAGWD
ncbi:LacI family DNA-binding transcriptional regulator [uncultured Sphingomonas sp.]|uniref:LacI family DNA-binding transcriptional regulator n=1 Tax=uncultured Sphingomonas sp. TaxID=158754 RepID=UPI0025D3FA5E|nr:LacI family DNA-binding transcriptional regulator [uncultured Sphingomonas sp.]